MNLVIQQLQPNSDGLQIDKKKQSLQNTKRCLPTFPFSTMLSWLDFFMSRVNTRLYPFSLFEDREDITSQLLSSLSKVNKNLHQTFCLADFFICLTEIMEKCNQTNICDLSSYCCRLTVSGGAFQVSIQERKDASVAVLHGLQRNVGGPVFEGIQGGVGQRNVAQTQLQGCLDTPKIKAVFIHPYLIQKNKTD